MQLITANRLMSGQMVLRIYMVKLKFDPTERGTQPLSKLGHSLQKDCCVVLGHNVVPWRSEDM